MTRQTPKVFYIETTGLLRSYAEKAFKALPYEVYTHDASEDPRYLIEDMLPQLILLDIRLLQRGYLWPEELLKASQIPVVLCGFREEFENEGQSNRAHLYKPFEHKNFGQEIDKLFQQLVEVRKD